MLRIDRWIRSLKSTHNHSGGTAILCFEAVKGANASDTEVCSAGCLFEGPSCLVLFLVLVFGVILGVFWKGKG